MPSLTASLVPTPLTQAMIQGKVKAADVDLDFSTATQGATSAIIEANSKRMLALDLDVAEMSFGTYSRARALGVPIVALPIFPGRRFLQGAIVVSGESGIEAPEDLRGKRASVGQFWQTASIWHRVLLHALYGVRQEEMTWVCGTLERWDQLPEPNAPVRHDSAQRSALALLEEGEVDAALLANANGFTPGQSGGAHRLFNDFVGASRQYFKDTAVFPIIHLIVMKAELAQDAGLVAALCEMFDASKQVGLEEMIENPMEGPLFGADPAAARSLFGADPYPYGVGANRRVLDTYLEDVYSHQHLTDRRLWVDELFAEQLPAAFK